MVFASERETNVYKRHMCPGKNQRNDRGKDLSLELTCPLRTEIHNKMKNQGEVGSAPYLMQPFFSLLNLF